MTIAEQLTKLNDAKNGIKDAIEAKGVTVGDAPLAEYPGKIAEISGGGEASRFGVSLDNLFGSLSEDGQLGIPDIVINLNLKGVKTLGVNALNHAFYGKPLSLADADASLDAPDLVEIKTNGCDGMFQDGWKISNISMPKLTTVGYRGLANAFAYGTGGNTTSMTIDLFNIESLGGYGMAYAFQYRNGLKQDIDFLKLTSIANNSFYNTFVSAGITAFRIPNVESAPSSAFWSVCSNCKSLQEVDMSGIAGVVESSAFRYAFNACSSLTTLFLPKISSIGSSAMDNMCQYCTALTTVDLSGLTTLYNGSCMQYAFDGCSALKTVKLNSLATVPNSSMNYCFRNCTSLERIDFPMLFEIGATGFGSSSSNYVFNGCTNLKEIHFRQDAQAVVEKTTGYADKWGATNAVVLFDLPNIAYPVID